MSRVNNDPGAPVDPEIDRRVVEIMRRPYRKVISGDPEQGFLIEVPDLAGCMTAGQTEVEAVALLPEAMAAWLTVALEGGAPIPEPTPEPGYSGRFLLRVSKTLHRRLAERAEQEGVSLNQWIATLLAEGMGRREVVSDSGGEEGLRRGEAIRITGTVTSQVRSEREAWSVEGAD